MAKLNCIVVTPEQTAVEAKADFVVLPLFDGEIGIGGDRAPMIGRLAFGEMRLTLGDQVLRYYLDGGFVQVANNIVSVLTNRAVPASQVDGESARLQLEDSRKLPIATPELEEIRDRTQSQARAQVRVANRA
jgi:F-type H+-transporting ATPase subunit epsilon